LRKESAFVKATVLGTEKAVGNRAALGTERVLGNQTSLEKETVLGKERVLGNNGALRHQKTKHKKKTKTRARAKKTVLGKERALEKTALGKEAPWLWGALEQEAQEKERVFASAALLELLGGPELHLVSEGRLISNCQFGPSPGGVSPIPFSRDPTLA
jgi:hypothetical protein